MILLTAARGAEGHDKRSRLVSNQHIPAQVSVWKLQLYNVLVFKKAPPSNCYQRPQDMQACTAPCNASALAPAISGHGIDNLMFPWLRCCHGHRRRLAGAAAAALRVSAP